MIMMIDLLDLPSLTLLKGDRSGFMYMSKVQLENIPSLTDEGIQLNESFINVIELNSLNADSLTKYIRPN